jgi:N-acetyl-gamma-glutamyl-phosphate reductase
MRKMSTQIKVGIVGITGYTGEELLTIIGRHSTATVTAVMGRSTSEARPIADFYPHITTPGLHREALDVAALAARTDVVFLALPHRVAGAIVPGILAAGKRVIDLSADFRLNRADVYETWYGSKHPAAELLPRAVYGLPELYRRSIATASLIANPGCYPTTVLLGCAPVLANGLIDLNSIIVDAKSGISGAGRKSAKEYFAAEHPNFRPYNIAGGHRHIPEIEQELAKIAGRQMTITFTPHIMPVERGMLSTIYMNLERQATTAEALSLYREYYKNEPFVRVLPDGELPRVKAVVGTNFCDIGLKVDVRAKRLVVAAAIDNLVKGASGQAVQNMNIMFGCAETDGFTPAASHKKG